ncbi:hypothetical protein CBR_g42154 [Chara braunii]|uniref:Uncharacterized protein n=1 Tax=Chara braunii TaxID=69332 RepID=A0A388LX17_CHABU|nr:hypothetical protein CBR_g42154 [Chara braunii]|eukprot:GBG86870.1 hypothetical protein CBR_g42154 [Chara braunii]
MKGREAIVGGPSEGRAVTGKSAKEERATFSSDRQELHTKKEQFKERRRARSLSGGTVQVSGSTWGVDEEDKRSSRGSAPVCSSGLEDDKPSPSSKYGEEVTSSITGGRTSSPPCHSGSALLKGSLTTVTSSNGKASHIDRCFFDTKSVTSESKSPPESSRSNPRSLVRPSMPLGFSSTTPRFAGDKGKASGRSAGGKKARTLEDLQRELAIAESEIVELRLRRKECKFIVQGAEERQKEAEKQAQKLRQEVEMLKARENVFMARVDRLENETKHAKEEVAMLEASVAVSNAQNTERVRAVENEWREEVVFRDRRIKELEDKVREKEVEIESWIREVEERDRRVKDKEEDIRSLKVKIATAEGEVSRGREKYREIQKEIERGAQRWQELLSSKDEEVLALMREKARWREDLQAMERQVEAGEQKVQDVQGELLRVGGEVARVEMEKSELLGRLDERTRELGLAREECGRLRRDAEDLKMLLADKGAETQCVENEVQRIRRECERLLAEIEVKKVQMDELQWRLHREESRACKMEEDVDSMRVIVEEEKERTKQAKVREAEAQETASRVMEKFRTLAESVGMQETRIEATKKQLVVELEEKRRIEQKNKLLEVMLKARQALSAEGGGDVNGAQVYTDDLISQLIEEKAKVEAAERKILTLEAKLRALEEDPKVGHEAGRKTPRGDSEVGHMWGQDLRRTAQTHRSVSISPKGEVGRSFSARTAKVVQESHPEGKNGTEVWTGEGGQMVTLREAPVFPEVSLNMYQKVVHLS